MIGDVAAPDMALALRAMDAIPGASILVFDPALRYVFARGSALARQGLRPEDLQGRPAREVLSAERWEVYEPRYRAALAGHSSNQQVRSPDGSAHYLVRISPLRDDHATIVGGVVISTEITEAVRAHEELAAKEAQFRLLAENASDVVLQTDADGVLSWVSPSSARVLGWEPGELVGQRSPQLLHPDDVEAANTLRALVYGGGEVTRHTMRLRTKSGAYRWMSLTAHPVRNTAGAVVGLVAGLRDADEETRARAALAASEALFRTALDNSMVGMALVEPDGRFRVVNAALCQLVGRDSGWMLAHAADDIVDPEDLPAVLADRAALVEGSRVSLTTSMRLVRSDGQVVWTRRSGAVIRGLQGDVDCLVLQWEDLTAEHHAAERLSFQAFHDPLTGLRNRSWILDMLEVDLRAAQREAAAVGVMFIDLDHFKLINDSLGHGAGDEVLCEVARRIEGCLRPTDRAGRFGGDEFVVVVNGVSSREQVEHVAGRILAAVGADFPVAGHALVPSVSIGMAMSDPASTSRALLRDTDAALYRAKEEGRGCWRFFDESMHAAAERQLAEQEEIRISLAQGRFLAHFQPIRSLTTRGIVGYEALAQWDHPTRGLVPAADFLATARGSGQIVDIGWQILDGICQGLRDHPALTQAIHVNASVEQLVRPDWGATFAAVLTRHAIAPARITLELPESVLVGLSESTRSALCRLAAFGVGLVIERFGSGLSPLPLLRELPISGIKLDPSFVPDLTDRHSPAHALASGMAGLARGLNLMGIAEGIETSEQAEALARQGWGYGQGSLLGVPAPLDEVLSAQPTPVPATSAVRTHD